MFNTLDLSSVINLTREKFYEICRQNPDMRLERTAKGELIVMAPTGGETSNWNANLTGEVALWSRKNQSGKTFDSSGGFSLPKGSDRSPDVSWITMEKWEALTPEQRKGFLPLCPDFVIELLSPSDSWHEGTRKMAEYMDNGCRLGWLIDPKSKRVAIYRENQPVAILTEPQTLSGEGVLVGFVLDISFIWEA
jgi:Uma2 family endonuclease